MRNEARCGLCACRRQVEIGDDPDDAVAILGRIMQQGWHVLHIEPPLPGDSHVIGGHSHSLVCRKCANRFIPAFEKGN